MTVVALDPHYASAEMMGVLNSLYPGHRLIDGGFPQLALSWRHGSGLALNLGGAGGAQDLFYAGFRQRGGHAPILDARSLITYLRTAAAPPATTVFAASAPALAALLEGAAPAARENDVFVVQDATEAPRAQDELAAAGFPAGLKLAFRRSGRTQSWVLAMRKGLDDEAFERVMAALRQVAVDIGGGANQQGWRDVRVDLLHEGDRPLSAKFAPFGLLHDCARRSEGDAAYSWLWAGAERRIRILLGAVPAHFTRLRIVVPNTSPTSNLGSARLFLNGDLAAHRVEIWGKGSGALDVELTPRREELVVTLAAPEATGEGAAALSICIDGIEVSA